MNKFVVLVAASAFALFGGCQKQQTEAERNAEVEREVQARLTAERQAEEQQRLAQQKGELDERERALREKQQAADTAARERPEESPPTQVFQQPSSGGESYSIFYTRLEPYGAWVETPTYGYVWQPRAATESRSWRPYTSGHWVYTDAGWTWISEEPFGWATYHYGRWTRLRGIGWVWVPGDEWAPAWVSWRTSKDYVGWAPLPPEARFEVRVGIHNWADNYYDIGPEQYCFVPMREIGAERIERAVVPAEQNVTIVNQTTNVTNITYNNTVIVNQGPNYDELRARSQQPIRRLRLERQTGVMTENPRLIVKGEVVEAPAPAIARAQPVAHPRVVKQKVTETVVEHGWEGVTDQKAAQQARAKIKSEATAPPNAPPKTFVKPAPVAGAPRAASPAPRATAAPVVRSTIAPAPTPPPPPMATTTPARLTRPAHTPPTVGTPALPAAQAGVPQQTPSPALTAAPRPRATGTALPIATPLTRPGPNLSPPSLPQQFSPVPTPTPAMTTPPGLGRAEQRRAEKELRKQERAERKAQRTEAAAPTATPSAAAPPGSGKDHKRHKRPGESEISPTATPAASP